MSHYIVFDSSTAAVIATIITSGPDQLAILDTSCSIEVDAEDYDSHPEQWAEVDKNACTLRPKPGKTDPTSKRRKPANQP